MTSPGRDESVLTLVADGDAQTRQLYRRYLTEVCRVEEAENGPDALAKIFAQHVNLLVTDTHLDGISGLDLCRLLRSDATTCALPMVVVTGDGSDADLARVKAAGADGVLVKPCSPLTLVEEAKRLLARSISLRMRGVEARQRARQQTGGSQVLLERSANQRRRWPAVAPGVAPAPQVPQRCPVCDRPLSFVESHVGGVLFQQEQWDYFNCPGGCGAFQYRHRTARLRRMR